MKVAASARGRGNSVLRCRLVLDHLEFVPVGIGEPEDRAPIFLLRRLRDLDALLAESGLFLRGVGRGEHVSRVTLDRKSTRLNSSHLGISYAVFCLKKKKRHK